MDITGNNLVKQYNYEEVIDKIMMERILTVIKENKRICLYCIKGFRWVYWKSRFFRIFYAVEIEF